MSEMNIHLPDGTPAVVAGLPEQVAIEHTQATTSPSEPNTINGRPEVGLDNPIVDISLGVTTLLIGATVWYKHHLKHPSKQASKL